MDTGGVRQNPRKGARRTQWVRGNEHIGQAQSLIGSKGHLANAKFHPIPYQRRPQAMLASGQLMRKHGGTLLGGPAGVGDDDFVIDA